MADTANAVSEESRRLIDAVAAETRRSIPLTALLTHIAAMEAENAKLRTRIGAAQHYPYIKIFPEMLPTQAALRLTNRFGAEGAKEWAERIREPTLRGLRFWNEVRSILSALAASTPTGDTE